MNDYDAFMSEMLEAGWTWEEANQAWEANLDVREYGIDYRHSEPFYSPDLFDKD